MREICKSGSTRGEGVTLIAPPSLLLYRLSKWIAVRIALTGFVAIYMPSEPRPKEAVALTSRPSNPPHDAIH